MAAIHKKALQGYGSLVILSVISASTIFALALTEKEIVAGERPLIIGIAQHEKLEWYQALEERGFNFRYNAKTRSFYTCEDPVSILEALKSSSAIGASARRALLERETEASFRQNWPHIENPRICLAFPTHDMGPTKGAEPLAVVFAKGLSKSEIGNVRSLIADTVAEMPMENILILGVDWRPHPGYGVGDTSAKLVKRTPETEIR